MANSAAMMNPLLNQMTNPMAALGMGYNNPMMMPTQPASGVMFPGMMGGAMDMSAAYGQFMMPFM